MTDQTVMRERILALKKDLNAIILAHNYQRPEVARGEAPDDGQCQRQVERARVG